MSGRDGFKQGIFVTTAAVVSGLVVAACAIQLRGDSDGALAGSASRATNPLGAKLERCRKVGSEQLAELQECRLIWAENRRRFLGSRTPAVSSVDAQPGSPTPSLAQPQNPDRRQQGWPPVVTTNHE